MSSIVYRRKPVKLLVKANTNNTDKVLHSKILSSKVFQDLFVFKVTVLLYCFISFWKRQTTWCLNSESIHLSLFLKYYFLTQQNSTTVLHYQYRGTSTSLTGINIKTLKYTICSYGFCHFILFTPHLSPTLAASTRLTSQVDRHAQQQMISGSGFLLQAAAPEQKKERWRRPSWTERPSRRCVRSSSTSPPKTPRR